MKTRKILILIFALLFALTLALCFTACNKNKGDNNPPAKDPGGSDVVDPGTDDPGTDDPITDNPSALDTSIAVPSGLSVSAVGKITWSRVSGVKSYDLYINGEMISRTYANYDIFSMETRPADGVFSIKVRAVVGEKHGNWSNLLSYTYKAVSLLYPTISGLDGTVLSWGKNDNSKNVELKLGNEVTLLESDAASYDLSALTADTKVSVTFKGDGVYYSDSRTASVVYHPSTKQLSLPAPENVRMEGSTLYYDGVLGANIYYFEDVNNTITTTNEELSDRTNRFLVRKIWAGNTDSGIGNSEPASVTYFTSEDGDGTKDNPFIISSTSELRFVEYYESVNQAKYYKFANDLVFEPYSPKPDEDISNFYNLGSLSGVIDGDGHSLKNTVVYYKDGYSSIFDSITGTGVIKNLVIENANWRTWTNRTNDGVMHEKGGNCAVLTYVNRGTISNVRMVNSSVCAARDGAGGLVTINRGVITDCTIDKKSEIYGANEAGGIAVFNAGTIKRCVNYGTVGGLTTVGGLVGRNCGVVSECGNEGTVNANTFGGGLVGYNFNIFDGELQFESLIEKCYNSGDINVTAYGGGIVGKNGGDGVNEVGVMSYANAGIYGCYNSGTISGSESLGGIVGDNYAYYEGSGDEGCGVRACFSIGEINVDLQALKSVRVLLSVENCAWANNDFPAFYLHYWGETGGSSFPGIRMKSISSGSKTYYYADIGIKADQLKGVIFNRINPYNTSEVYSQSSDITGTFSSGGLLFSIDSDWASASVGSSESIVANADFAVGTIAGYSNMLNDCYYVMGAMVNGKPIGIGVAGGSQFNKTYKNGTEIPASALGISVAQFATLDQTLNEILGEQAFTQDSNGLPVLCWQIQE